MSFLNNDSFRIFSNTNIFKWFSRDIQGDVIDFVRLVKGISFKEALGFSQEPFQKEAVQEKRERLILLSFKENRRFKL